MACLPDDAVEAAAKAAYSSMTYDPQPWSDDSLARAIPKALAAALPAIRAHIADQIDTHRKGLSSGARNGAYGAALVDASLIARGGAS